MIKSSISCCAAAINISCDVCCSDAIRSILPMAPIMNTTSVLSRLHPRRRRKSSFVAQ